MLLYMLVGIIIIIIFSAPLVKKSTLPKWPLAAVALGLVAAVYFWNVDGKYIRMLH